MDAVLLLTADRRLAERVVGLAAAAGARLEPRQEVGPAAAGWSRVPLVLVGADRAGAVASAGLPRRDHVAVLVPDGAEPPWPEAVGLGASQVLRLPPEDGRLVELLADAVDGRPRPAPVVGVLAGRGGAGASTLAAGLALTAARSGTRALLVDGDPLGGGLDLLVGREDAPGLRWADLAETRGRVSGRALCTALPRLGDLRVLSWDRREPLEIPPAAMTALLAAGRRASDLVVVDLPRSLDPAGRVAAQRCGTTVLVVPADVRSVAAAARLTARLAGLPGELAVVVRRAPAARLPSRDVGEVLGLPVMAEMAHDPALPSAAESGMPPAGGRGSLAQLCRALLGLLAVPRDEA